jgi:hypothetical protein
MPTQRFFTNPYFLKYVRLLRQLHQLIRAGTDKTEEGESLREQMDEPAAHLTSEEVECLNAISADFYTLSGSTVQHKTSAADVQERLKEMSDARDAGDYVKALDLARQNEPYLDPAAVAEFRGRVWAEAGEKEIAGEFFRRGTELSAQSRQLESGTV